MDLKAKIEEIVGKLKKDPEMLKNFKSDPVKTVKGLVDIELPKDQLEALVSGIKAKLGSGNLIEKIKKLFKK